MTASTGSAGRRAQIVAVMLALVLGALAVWWLRAVPPVPPEDAGPPLDAVQQTLQRGLPTVVEFGANSCTTCREMKPVLAGLARDHGDRISVVDIDLMKTSGYPSRYKIQLMPTQVFFDAQGRETGRHLGKISADEILAQLDSGTR